MKTLKAISILVLVISPKLLSGQSVIPNGDFEADFTGWTPVDSVAISTDMVHAGSKSLWVNDTTATAYSYSYQELSLDYGMHEVSFWVYPASSTYFSAFELIANWQAGTAVFITRVLMTDSTLSFTAVDAGETIPTLLTQTAWSEITIRVDSTNFTQEFYVNGQLASTLTSSSFPTIEHLLVGDLSITGMYGELYFDDISIVEMTSTDASDIELPSAIDLHQNYPNPFNPSTRISYNLFDAGDVDLSIYRVDGSKVRTLVGEFQSPGMKSIVWDARDDEMNRASTGVYYLRLRSGDFQETKKMILIR